MITAHRRRADRSVDRAGRGRVRLRVREAAAADRDGQRAWLPARADLARLEAWGTAMVASFVHGKGHRNVLDAEQLAEQATALEEFRDYVRDQIADKRRSPGDDMTHLPDRGSPIEALGRKLHDPEIRGRDLRHDARWPRDHSVRARRAGAAAVRRPRALPGDPRPIARSCAPSPKRRMRLRAPTQGLSTRVTTRDEVFQGVDGAGGLTAPPAFRRRQRRRRRVRVPPRGEARPQAHQRPPRILPGPAHLPRRQHLAHRAAPSPGIACSTESIAWSTRPATSFGTSRA